jgi:hypothetical protein
MWTLAIEGQFYIVWPLVVALCICLARGSKWLLAGVTAAGIAASSITMAVLFDPGDPVRSYYGTDTRVQALLAGALLAIILSRFRPAPTSSRRWQLVGVAALTATLALWLFATITSPRYYQGGSVAYAVLAGLVIVAATQPGPLSRSLAWRPIALIGVLSYGIYLFHWPVIIWLVPSRVPFDGLALDALRMGVTLVLAVASYYLVESPIRERRLPTFLTSTRPRALSIGVAASALTLLVIMASAREAQPPPSYLAGVRPQMQTPAVPVAQVSPVPSDAAAAPTVAPVADDGVWHYGDPLFCGPPRDDEQDAADDAVGDLELGAQAQGLRILLVGDSTACSFLPGLTAAADAVGADVVNASVIGCGVASGEVGSTRGEQVTPRSHRCPALVDLAISQASAGRPPDVVVWMSIWEKSDLVIDGRIVDAASREGRAEMRRRMDFALARVAGPAPVAVVGVAAAAPNDAPGKMNTSNPVDDASYERLDTVLHDFATRHPAQVHLIDLASRLCPGGAPCPREVDGSVPRPDGRHLTPEAAGTQARWLLPQVVELVRPG